MDIDTKEQLKSIFKLIEKLEKKTDKTDTDYGELKERVIHLEKSLETLPIIIKEQNQVQTLELEKAIDCSHQKIKDEFDLHLINEGKAFKQETIKIVLGVVSAVLIAMVLITLKLK